MRIRFTLFPWRALSRDGRGSITVLMAGSMTMLIGVTALAVDVGSIYLGKRQLQGVADAAALAAASAISDPDGAAARAVAASGGGNIGLAPVTKGGYTPDAAIDPALRFVAGATPANATQVTLTRDVPIFFGQFLTGHATTSISAKATAARTNLAAFSIGSRLAAVQGGLPNALLSGLTGTSLNLTVMDYNALAGANIDILVFSEALRTEAHLSAASFGETLNTRVTLPQALSALASVSGSDSATVLRAIALKVPATTIRLSDLIDLGPLADEDVVDPARPIQVDGYAVVRELLQLAGGQRQVTLDLGLSLPGIASTKLTVAIGERPAHSPWLAVTQDGSMIVRTAQTRLYLDTNLAGGLTGGLVSVRLPIFIELAQAQAKLSAISCAAGPSRATVTLDVQPAVGQIQIADIDPATLGNFTAPVTARRAIIAHAILTNVTGQAAVTLGGVTWQQVPFSAADITAGRVQTVSTNDITQGIASSLISRIDLRVEPINLSLLTATVGALLTPLAPVLDGVLDSVTGLLGVRVGQADVRVDGLRCGRPMLVH